MIHGIFDSRDHCWKKYAINVKIISDSIIILFEDLSWQKIKKTP